MKSALLALSVLLSASASAQEKPQDLPAWMTGAWEKTEGEKWADEFWTPPRAGIMIGASRSGNGTKLGLWEHMRIIREADGNLAFWAITGNQSAVRFAATMIAPNEIIFENAEHDYPQRIRYWRDGADLYAEISLADGSRAVPFGFHLMGAPTPSK